MAKTKRDQPAKQAQTNGGKDMASWKPGSEPEQAKAVAGKGDFGVPAGEQSTIDRDYVSGNTKASDPRATQPMDWENDGKRDHGVGARDSGPGSGSGGDVDPDIIGLGQGGSSVSLSGPDDRRGPDDVDGAGGASAAFGAPPPQSTTDAVVEPARGANQTGVGQIGGAKPIRGSTVQPEDVSSGGDAQGADAVTNPSASAYQDDSFVGEISSGEALGQDNAIAPSSDTQGLGENGDSKDPRDS